MAEHPVIGEGILRRIPQLAPLAPIVRHEHEHWDGTGYPDGLSGRRIPIGSRIILACDAYAAMMTERPYRRAARPRRGRGAAGHARPEAAMPHRLPAAQKSSAKAFRLLLPTASRLPSWRSTTPGPLRRYGYTTIEITVQGDRCAWSRDVWAGRCAG
jgi:hypothetical protein